MNFKKMYKKMPAILKRTLWAKSLGFLISFSIFIVIIATGSYDTNPMIAWGILLWYPMLGVMIGLAGIMNEHPLLGKIGIWRGITLGTFMNFVLMLFAHDSAMDLISSMGMNNISTPMIFIGIMLEGAIIGGAIDAYVTTKFGEGKKLMKK